MYKKHEIGKLGEKLAEKYLKENNYKIIEKNFRCRQGEIDIIAEYKKEIIFVEVKTRSTFVYGTPAEAVDERKKEHIVRSANYYLYSKNLNNRNIRFDIIEILLYKTRYKLNHIKQII